MKLNMKTKKTIFYLQKLMIIIILAIVVVGACSTGAFAEFEKNTVIGNVFEFDEDTEYEFSKSKSSVSSDKAETYGKFFISGKFVSVSAKNNIPTYEVTSNNLDIYYNYSDNLLKAEEKKWHIIEDKGKRIDGKKLDKKILKGAIILQTSKDRKNWTDVKCITNAFNEKPIRTEVLYTTTDVQILNGCYYRLIVAYKTQKLNGIKNFMFVPLKNYEDKKTAEVYEFYAYAPSTDNTAPSPEQTYALGSKTRVADFDGYSGSKEIDKNDVHYGWDIGQFFVSGYTEKIIESNGNVVFLKNVGDKVTLWFNLKQDINKLNKNEDLKITADIKGYDQHFETPRMNFGKGTLIVRHTDYNNNTSKPQIYTNYLEASASVGANTKVQLFEEGDYEIALDYEVTSDKLIDKVGHYRIFFTYSVRNGNCMVYPIDAKTGSELTNSSMTENGFLLDFAKSRYLQINVKREILSESADGLVEDTRFNGPAKDGAEYTEEGIYTITAKNQYTNQTTTKKIYVGSNNVLKAFMTSGLSIENINKLVSEGATIDNNGVITLSNGATVGYTNNESNNNNSLINNTKTVVVIMVIVVLLISIACGIVIKKRKNVKRKNAEKKGVTEL